MADSNDKDYGLSVPAEQMYQHLARHRQPVIDTGRDMAEITIPSVFPPDGYVTGDNINDNNQSVGALCVNTLASKLMFLALPPDRPVLRFQPIEQKLQQDIEQNPELWDMVQVGLSRLELEHRNRIEATNTRSAYVGSVKALLVAGNVLWEHIDIDHPCYHLPTKYVCKRNQRGEPLLSILERTVDVTDLEEDIQEQILTATPELRQRYENKMHECRVDIYVVCKRAQRANDGEFYWKYWEEYKGELIPGTEFDAKFEEPPLYPAWLIPVYGQNWGRSYCEEYRGDLMSVENLSAAVNDGAAAASMLWLFLNPGSRTSLRQLKKAENMSLMVGKGDDITSFKLDKGMDFNFVSAEKEKIIQRLGRAFLLVSSIQRQAERVTAEEWDKMAQEVEEAMGGLYSELAQSFQRHVVRRFVALHNDESKDLPKLPEGVFRIAVITGIEAMGRALEGQALVRAVGTVLSLFKEQGGQYLSILSFIRRIMMSESIKMDGLVLDEKTVAASTQQRTQQGMMQELMSKAAGPMAGAMAKNAPQMMQMANQQQQQSPDGQDMGLPPSPETAQQLNPPAQ